jgi:DNA-directed RNA polymerase subunit beta'
VLGCYYLTKDKKDDQFAGRKFSSADEVILALDSGDVHTQTPIKLMFSGDLIDLEHERDDQDVMRATVRKMNNRVIDTTVGRVILNEHMPAEMPYINGTLKKKGLTSLVNYCHLRLGHAETVRMLDKVKDLGFLYATKAGISIGIDDLVTPPRKVDLVQDAQNRVVEVENQYKEGIITNGERYNKVIAIWSEVTEEVAKAMFDEMNKREKDAGELNPILVMADSGARGSKQQIRQLAGMRGLMAKPSGEIIETPIRANFREGLNVLQYFISTHGARKGLADTALKTADSGYLTRRLVDVAQDVIISEHDCGTIKGIWATAIIEGGEEIESLRDRIIGRVALDDVRDPITGEVLVGSNQEITEDLAAQIQLAGGIERVRIRSVLTCESRRGVCIKCYGRNLATGQMVELGEATGVIAAQSIGEPGTQLTMRTFHIGGVAGGVTEITKHEARTAGTVKFEELKTVRNREGDLVAMNRNGSIVLIDERGRETGRYQIVYGATLKVTDGQRVEEGQELAEWDPFTFAILTEDAGIIHFKDLIEGVTVREEVDEVTGLSHLVVVDSPDEKRQPRIEIRDDKNKVLRTYQMPVRANLLVADHDDWKKKRGGSASKQQEEKEHVRVAPGDIIAKIPRETTKTKDITGGLPRVVELFEARKPRETAVMTEIDGVVKFGPITKGLRKVVIEAADGEKREYSIPRGVHINVQEGDNVRAGEPLMDGPLNPHDILAVRGIEELQRYLVNEIQEVYRLQGVNINDKHIEVIVRQMLRWVRIKDVGDTEFLLEDMVDRFRFQDENERVIEEGGQPAQAEPLLLGITKASLSTESFISAASFQETTRVLTEAAISGKVDYLRGLKENVIMGRLIPAGTGMEFYRQIRLEADRTEETEEFEYEAGEMPAGQELRAEAKEVGD